MVIVGESDLMHADMFVAANPSAVARRLKIVAIAFGKPIVVPNYIVSKGKKGPCIAYKPAIETPRHIWISGGGPEIISAIC